ncbi:MAG: hypothetical protein FD133_1904 [Erysipelotrichaceae bacterium]|nr:MAG: hypothetical protein FD179_1893 [Erysipelotrichaceae bacterium]TXT16251.1 MAG: hypothetical protein FD133_1904 [Erysipelotrichaceae bacterium]
MKKLISFAFVLGLMMFTVLGVKAESMELKSVETIMVEIRLEQNISSTGTIDIAKVSDVRLEELGDSVMELVIGNNALHERMDIALGGEGSISLTNVHIRVGYNYLAGIPITMMTFMGARGMMAYGGMMGSYDYFSQNNTYLGYGGMMGSYDYFPQNITALGYGGMMGGFGWIWMILGTLVFIALLVFGFIWLTKTTRKQETTVDNKALLILKERYAKGEITKEEYSRMVDILK